MKFEDFNHRQYAHCESGVTANLLRYHGLEISEPMIFGIGGGYFFGHLPFVKVNGVPGTTFRIWPGAIFKRVSSQLKIPIVYEKFKNTEKAKQRLKEVLDKNIPVGMLSSVYYLPYLPSSFRFHFNAHNLLCYGYEQDTFFISDPVMETNCKINYADLEKARFAKGYPEPSGKMYYPSSVPKNPDLRKAAIRGINHTHFMMTSPPIPFFGINGIRFLANKIEKYPKVLEERKALLYLANIIRMQEEIGTGGAGFRFIYAAFLKETAALLQNEKLDSISTFCTETGDAWRNFAYEAGRVCKSREAGEASFKQLKDLLMLVYKKEQEMFRRIKALHLKA